MGKIGEIARDAVSSVVSFIGKPFGIYDHNETFTDIQVMNLLTPEQADKGARRSAIHNSGGDSKIYLTAYRAFQRQYKRRYSKRFLENIGYLPSSTATTRAINESSVKTYLQSSLGYTNITIESARDKYLTLSERSNYGRQFVAGYDNSTGTVLSGGKTYNFLTDEELSPTSLRFKFLRSYTSSITDNLTDNYSYIPIDNTITIGNELYNVGLFSSVINGSDQYETVCTHLPKEIVDITITAVVESLYNGTVSFPEDADSDGFVQLTEITGDLDIHIDLPVESVIGNELIVTIDGVPTAYTVDQVMIDNGLDLLQSTYSTTFMPTLSDETILTTAERFEQNYTNTLFDNECTYVTYRVISGEVDSSIRYYIAAADSLPIYITGTLDMTAVIPMKENNVVVNENKKLNKILKKLNLSHEQLVASISDPNMDAAYLITGLTTTINNNAHNKVMFNTFDSLSPGSGNITISISQLSMTYSFSLVRNTVTGVVAPVGKYVRTGVNSGGITLRYQGSATEYQELIISNYNQRYVISGQVMNANFTSEDTRIIVPLDIFNSLKYREWVVIYENSLAMIGYSTETVEIKWYETAAFGFVLQVLAIIWTIVTFASDSGAVLTATQAFVAAAKAFAINYIIYKVVLYIADLIGGQLGALVAMAAVMYMTYVGGGQAGVTGSELWLKTAINGLSMYTEAIAKDVEEKLKDLQDELDKLVGDITAINKKLEEQEGDPTLYASGSLPFETVGSPNKVFQTAEQYVNSIVNTEWLVDGSWMYDIDREISTRNSVYAG